MEAADPALPSPPTPAITRACAHTSPCPPSSWPNQLPLVALQSSAPPVSGELWYKNISSSWQSFPGLSVFPDQRKHIRVGWGGFCKVAAPWSRRSYYIRDESREDIANIGLKAEWDWLSEGLEETLGARTWGAGQGPVHRVHPPWAPSVLRPGSLWGHGSFSGSLTWGAVVQMQTECPRRVRGTPLWTGRGLSCHKKLNWRKHCELP